MMQLASCEVDSRTVGKETMEPPERRKREDREPGFRLNSGSEEVLTTVRGRSWEV